MNAIDRSTINAELTQIDQRLETEYTTHHRPSLSALIVQGQATLWAKSWGFADLALVPALELGVFLATNTGTRRARIAQMAYQMLGLLVPKIQQHTLLDR